MVMLREGASKGAREKRGREGVRKQSCEGERGGSEEWARQPWR